MSKMQPTRVNAVSSALIVHAGREAAKDAMHLVGSGAKVLTVPMKRFAQVADNQSEIVIFDLVGFSDADLDAIAVWRDTAASVGVSIVFVAENAMRAKLIRRGLSRDANMIKRPLHMARLPALITYLDERAFNSDLAQLHLVRSPEHSEALQQADSILGDIFGQARSAASLDLEQIANRTDVLIGSLGEGGLATWVDAVRMHHSLTYQHCLLVTGTLLAFGHHLKMAAPDLKRLALGGLLHDIGKADIPLSILDKPAALTPEELLVMRTHPDAGVKRLKKVYGVTDEIRIFTRDHHEFLDGSGYPNGLMAENISDPVRLLTIADIFAALIERRAYKKPMSPERAIAIMEGMTGKLDPMILASVLPVLQNVNR